MKNWTLVWLLILSFMMLFLFIELQVVVKELEDLQYELETKEKLIRGILWKHQNQ